MSFCTAVNCMDGRVQLPVIRYLQKRFGAEYVDSITEPGPNGIIAAGADSETIDSIVRRVGISVNHHGSKGIAVVGHYDCAGNPEPEEKQNEQTLSSVELLRSRFGGLPVIGLWLDESWKVSELSGK